jgi:pimeloyl-ACP methyl ester carboxylesterase
MPHVAARGAEIYYEVHGEGPALVLAHGAGGNAASWWQQVPHFVDRYRVVVFDHRMFGRSTGTAETFETERFAEDIRAILDREGIERAAFVCQSMGGWGGSRLAAESPERVAALVMSHTPGCFSNERIAAARSAVPPLDPPTRRFGHWALAPGYPDEHPAGAYLYNQISSLNQFDRSLLTALRTPSAWIDTATLTGYSVPTLFVTAEQDGIFPPSLIESVAGSVPGAELVVIAGAGHSSYFETPDAFNETVGAFLARHYPA